MKTIVNNILNKLEEVNFIGKNPFLGADAMMSNNDIKIHSLSPINRDIYIYIYNIGRDKDIIIGEKYNIIFNRENPKDYQKTDCEIDFLSLKKNDNIGIIPRGYGGCVRLKFKDKVPEMVKFLKQDQNEKYDKEKHRYLFFTTQEVMGKILEELDKAENT